MSGAIAGYVAYRFGVEVGTGTPREAAYVDAWNNGMRIEVDVLPVDAVTLGRAERAIKCRRWNSELELLRDIEAATIQGIDYWGSELPWMDDVAIETLYFAIRRLAGHSSAAATIRGSGTSRSRCGGGARPMLIEVAA